MRSKWLYAFRLILIVSVVGVVGYRQAKGESAPPGEPASIDGEVSNAFNYQGSLRESGQAVTGTRDMTFSLHLDNTCSAVNMLETTTQSVLVSNGLFNAALSFHPWHYDGRALYLKIAVAGTDVACQELRPVPYALSLRPGATIKGWPDSEPAFTVLNMNTSTAWSEGILGKTNAPHSSGVTGVNYEPDGYGLRGIANPDGIAVRAEGKIWSDQDTVLMLSPMGLVERGSSNLLTLSSGEDGSMTILTNGTGWRYAVLPVQAPAVLFGSRSYVKSLEVCFSVSAITARVMASSVIQYKPITPYYEIYAMDSTPRNNTDIQCYTATAAPRRPIENSLWVQFNLDSSVAPAYWIIHTIKLTIGQFE